jgi:hypothetical protein
MHLPLPNFDLKHLVSQNDHRFRPSACQNTYFPLDASFDRNCPLVRFE